MWDLVSAMKGLGAVPELARYEQLAQHWHCTPAEARAQDENDELIAVAWQNAAAEVQCQQAYFEG
jgi:hypothetical protein